MNVGKYKWLSRETKKIISDYISISWENKLLRIVQEVVGNIKKPSMFWVAPLFVIFCFGMCFLNLPIPGIYYLSRESSLEMLNNRLADFFSILGTTIAVAVFVIGAMQAKREGEEQFSLVFLESYLYPILFFMLASGGALTLLTLFQNTLISDDIFSKMVILGNYLVVIELILVGFLFIRVFHFVNTDYLLEKYLSNVIHAGMKRIEEELFERMSRKIYETQMNSLGASLAYFGREGYHKEPILSNLEGVGKLKDVNIKNLSKVILQNKEIKIGYVRSGIGQTIHPNSPLLFLDSDDKNIRSSLLKSFIIKKQKHQDKTFDLEMTRLKVRFQRVLREDNISSVEQILDVYYSIYKVFADKMSQYQVETKQEEFPGSDLWSNEWETIEQFDNQFYEAYEIAVKQSNRGLLDVLSSYNYRMIRLALESKNITLFRIYTYSYLRCYHIASKNKEIVAQITEQLITEYITFISLRLLGDFKELKNDQEKESLRGFIFQAYNVMSLLLKAMIEKHDFQLYQKVFRLVEQIEPRLEMDLQHLKIKIDIEKRGGSNSEIIEAMEKQYQTLSIPIAAQTTCIFGIQAWIWYLFDLGKISEADLKQLSVKPQSLFEDQSEIMSAYLSYTIARNTPFGWDHWAIDEPPIGEIYQPIDSRSWILFGIVMILIRDTHVNPDDLFDIENTERWMHRYEEIENVCDRIISAHEKWKSVLGGMSDIQLKNKCDQIKLLFSNLSSRIQLTLDEKVVGQSISKERIKDFEKSLGAAWEQTGKIRKAFEAMGGIVPLDSEAAKEMLSYGHRVNLEGGKVTFVEDGYENIYGLEGYGTDISRIEDEQFALSVTKAKKTTNKYINASEALNALTKANNKYSGGARSLIVMSNELLWKDKSLRNNPDFVESWKDKVRIKPPFDGTYKEVPIVLITVEIFKNKIAFIEIPNGIIMRQVRSIDRYKQQLKISVNEITEEMAAKMIDKKPEFWLNKKDKILTREQAILRARKSISIHVEEAFDFFIHDPSMIEVVTIDLSLMKKMPAEIN